MATITLNGQSNINDVTCFSYAPTILKIASQSGGSNTIYQFNVNKFDASNKSIKINDVVLTRVNNIEDAKGFRYYLNYSTTDADKKLMLNSIMEAIKRIPEVAAGYYVYVPWDSSTGGKTNNIVLCSLTYGNNTPLNVRIGNSNASNSVSFSRTIGSTSSELKEGDIKIDVTNHGTAMKYNSGTTNTGQYTTTLSKHVAGDESVKFDLGPLFASMTEEGKVGQFGLNIYLVNNDGLTELGYFNSVYNANGYIVNQGQEFLNTFNDLRFAINVERGEKRAFLNNSLLYLYEETIPLSLYVGKDINSITASIKYINSDGSTLLQATQTINTTQALTHFTLNLIAETLHQSKYVDVTILNYNVGTIRFNVIKPIRATDECQRIYWYNSYGGVSFFDFTGNRTEERKVKTTTYQDSILEYYENNVNEKDYIYSKTNEIEVKLTTHNIHKDGQWQLFDLQQSRTAWTYINGVKCRVIVEDVTINTTNVTDIYTGTVSYRYSMGVNI